MCPARDMDIEKRKARIAHLMALAEHPDTPLHEAESARRVAATLRDAVSMSSRTEMDTAANGVFKNARPKTTKAKLGKLRNRKDAKKRVVPGDWPFDWKVRVPVEYERGKNPQNGEIVIGWKCPSCGDHVVKTIGARHQVRLRGQAGGIDSHVEVLTDGTLNQLCLACWDKYSKN